MGCFSRRRNGFNGEVPLGMIYDPQPHPRGLTEVPRNDIPEGSFCSLGVRGAKQKPVGRGCSSDEHEPEVVFGHLSFSAKYAMASSNVVNKQRDGRLLALFQTDTIHPLLTFSIIAFISILPFDTQGRSRTSLPASP